MTVAATLTRIRRIAAVPLQCRRSQGSLRSLWFTIGFAMFLPVLILLTGIGQPQGRIVGEGFALVMASVLLFGAWAVFFTSLHEQAAFATAPLVPGHDRHLRLTLLAGVLVVCAIEGVGFGIVFGQGFVASVVALAVLTLAAAAMRRRWLSGIFVAAAVAWHSVPPGAWNFEPVMRMLFEHRFLASPVLLATCAAILAAASPSSRRPVARKPRMPHLRDGGQRADRNGRVGAAADGRVDAPKAYPLQACWHSGRLPPRHGDPLQRALALLALDSRLAIAWRWQWRRWLYIVALSALMAFDPLKDLAGVVFLMVAGQALAFMAADVIGVRAALGESRREQALISLLPGVPNGAALARALANRLSATYAIGLARGIVALGLVRAVMVWSGAPLAWYESPAALSALPLACVPLATLLWTNWAHPAALRLNLPGPLAALVLLAGFAMLAPHFGWASLATVAALYAAPTVLWCAWRFRRMAREPSPFPAGRLA